MKTIYLIRHGQTQWNVEKRMQGRLDSALTKSGIAQAHSHGKWLKARANVEELWVSPSGRARETAHILNSYVRAPIEFDVSLLERDVGEWSGLTMDEIQVNFPQAWEARLADPYQFRPPGGENIEDMLARCTDFIDGLLGGDASEIVLLTHQVISRVIISYLLELKPEEMLQIVHPNDLMYRFQMAAENTDVTHFIDGRGPHAGLRRQRDGETITLLDTK